MTKTLLKNIFTPTECYRLILLSEHQGKNVQAISFLGKPHIANGNFLKAVEAISVNEETQFFLEQFKQIMRNSWARNVRGMKEMADVLAGIGRERQKNFLAYCQHLVRENFVYRFQAPELNYMNREEATFSIKFSPFINERNVFDIMEELALAERHITQNVNAKMVFFDLSLRLTVLIKR